MRWLILWAATAATALGQGGNLSGTVFDLDTGRTQVISIRQSEDDYVANLRKQTLEGYRRMNAELEVSIANMRQESELRQQTREMREQTELLRNISKEKSGDASSSYVPPPIIVAPSSHVPRQTTQEHAVERQHAIEQDIEIQVLGLARRAKSFNSATKQVRERQLSAREGAEYGNLTCPSNEEFIKSLLQAYEGSFTDYAWKSVKVDPQTFTVTCSVSLDGEPYDFLFKINLEVGTCRYEGGTALAKLAPPQAKRKFIPLDGEASTGTGSGFDPDAYLMDATWLQGNKVVLNTKTLKEGREAGYSDEEIWSYLVSKDKSFASEKSAGRTLDQLAAAKSAVSSGMD